jgi:hypothetical protein
MKIIIDLGKHYVTVRQQEQIPVLLRDALYEFCLLREPPENYVNARYSREYRLNNPNKVEEVIARKRLAEIIHSGDVIFQRDLPQCIRDIIELFDCAEEQTRIELLGNIRVAKILLEARAYDSPNNPKESNSSGTQAGTLQAATPQRSGPIVQPSNVLRRVVRDVWSRCVRLVR